MRSRARLALIAVLLSGAAVVPAAARTVQPTTVDPGYTLNGVACPSVSQCTAVDGHGRQVTFNPTAPGTPTPTTVDSTGNQLLFGVACPSATQCTAVANEGNEVTFDPTAPGTPTPVPLGNGLAAVACPSTTQCTAVGSDGKEVTFDPTSPGTPTPVTIDGDQLINDVACPAANECVAVAANGAEVTFDPPAPGTPPIVTIEAGGDMLAVSCPSTNQCIAADNGGGIVTFNPLASPPDPKFSKLFNGGGVDLACPSTTQCTLLDTGGSGWTFDPAAPGGKFKVAAGGGQPTAMACPTNTQCTAVSTTGQQATFDPTLAPKPGGGNPGGGGPGPGPGPGPGSGGNPTPTVPTISFLQQSATTWREPKNPRLVTTSRAKVPIGTTFSYTLDQPAAVRLSFSRGKTGRKVKGHCVRQRKSNKKKPKCKIVDGRLTFAAHQGLNRINFQGRISKTKKLAPGHYRLSISATTGPGKSSAPKTLSFTIVK